MGLNNATGIGLVACAIVIWVAAFVINGFYVQSEMFDRGIIEPDRLSEFEDAIDSLQDGEFELTDSIDFVSTAWLSFGNMAWWVLVIVNVLPILMFTLGVVAILRGGS